MNFEATIWKPRTIHKIYASSDMALRQSLRYWWRTPSVLITILLALNLLDALATHVGLRLGALEANPIVAGLIGEVGEAPAYVTKLTIVLIAGILLLKLGRTNALNWLNRGMAIIVISNISVLIYQLLR